MKRTQASRKQKLDLPTDGGAIATPLKLSKDLMVLPFARTLARRILVVSGLLHLTNMRLMMDHRPPVTAPAMEQDA